MKTSISAFCTEFSEALFPLAEALGDAHSALEALGDTAPAGLAGDVANARHRVEALLNKVQGQESYVLLFGPLKSGKSTLINAISGGYVSEVSSLPAYPCMVYLRYGPEPAYSVIRYSGKREKLTSPEQLHELLTHGHRTLSDRIRAMDELGEEFDPEAHLPSAIRRVFVELPMEQLRESATVLVDTPGLYSKMKFGYDYMTQEFRDSAACALFVVKADNLFLEQVFSDFNDLLDQFSRVFVVVNIDTGKSDLQPDGTLAPSLESRDPGEVVKAFEVLTMSAPLRRAAESGRLHIYPIDLRSVASQRLQGAAEETGDERFDNFMSDLMSYLNSNEYLLEFKADTMQQANRQCREIIDLAGSGSESQLETVHDELTRSVDALERRGNATEDLLSIDWQEVLTPALGTADGELAEARRRVVRALLDTINPLLEGWNGSDASLEMLQTDLGQALRESTREFRQAVSDTMVRFGTQGAEAAKVRAAVVEQPGLTGFDMDALCSTAAGHLKLGDAVEPPGPKLDALPVKKTFLDTLLFRKPEDVRKRLIPDTSQPVPAAEKARRLAPEAPAYVQAACESSLEDALAQVEKDEYRASVHHYLEIVTASVETGLRKEQTTQARERREIDGRLQSLEHARQHIGELAQCCAIVLERVAGMESTHPLPTDTAPAASGE